MISFINTIKKADRSVVATCLLGSALPGTGMPGVNEARLSERPIQAPAVAAVAQAMAYAFATNGAESRTIQQHHKTWAFRRLEPWSYPA
ncbi:hypothetical protein ACFV27_27470 [Streptomyces antimycoticus]|uniref:Uncharacterized protein n=3 Tax=Streptomyces TaxID=1883 RepID=A0ABD5JCZ7_9ACTN|nr:MULTISPECIES: hypothetical protein [Streptomyces]MEE4585119.1 hypothetical protein [Streptomyces sp. DSM 41602]AJZ82667.1 hypothetical protein AS97_05885 [Streptomyces sp. AgN23]KUL56614.1 hypothetical protein ADL28_20570 [Streptomyces violaceusniger]RSS40147.1 hypothetical protein EF902_25750 [Streptomyces sp. WAC05858]WJD97354.1 hypothetical protein QR300_15950 [Streptomyces antimycoticus]